MPVVDLHVNYEDVQDMDKFPVVPNGVYDFVIKALEPKSSKAKGRPMFLWTFTITDPETGQPTNILNNTVLPWIPPGENEVDASAVGMLVQTCKSVGMPWTGGKIATEDYVGRGGRFELIQKPKQIEDGEGNWVNDPSGEKVNQVKKFIY